MRIANKHSWIEFNEPRIKQLLGEGYQKYLLDDFPINLRPRTFQPQDASSSSYFTPQNIHEFLVYLRDIKDKEELNKLIKKAGFTIPSNTR